MHLLDRECTGSMGELLAFVEARRSLATRSRIAKHVFLLVVLAIIGLAIAAEADYSFRRIQLEVVGVLHFDLLSRAPWPLSGLLHLALHGALAFGLYRVFFSTRFPQSRLLLVLFAVPFSWVGAVFVQGVVGVAWSFLIFASSHLPLGMAMRSLFFLAPILSSITLLVVRWIIGWRWHVIPERIDAAKTILETLRFDCAEGKGVSLRLDLQPAFLQRKKISKQGAKPGTRVYVDPWFELRMRMNDGNQLTLRTIFRITEKRKSKRKYTKINERYFGAVSIDLRVNAKRYPALGDVAKIQGHLLDGEFTVTKVVVRAQRIRLLVRGRSQSRHQGRYSSSKGLGTTPLVVGPDVPLMALSILYAHLGKMRLPPKVMRKLRKGSAPGGKASAAAS